MRKENLACTKSNHIPNKETRKAIKQALKGKNLIRGKKAEEITKKFSL